MGEQTKDWTKQWSPSKKMLVYVCWLACGSTYVVQSPLPIKMRFQWPISVVKMYQTFRKDLPFHNPQNTVLCNSAASFKLPRVFFLTSRAILCNSAASLNLPMSSRKTAKLFIEVRVSGCSGPKIRFVASSSVLCNSAASFKIAHVFQNKGQIVHWSQSVWVLRSQNPLRSIKFRPVQLSGFSQLAHVFQNKGQIVHGSQSVWVLRSQNLSSAIQNRPVQLSGFFEFAHVFQNNGEIVHWS